MVARRRAAAPAACHSNRALRFAAPRFSVMLAYLRRAGGLRMPGCAAPPARSPEGDARGAGYSIRPWISPCGPAFGGSRNRSGDFLSHRAAMPGPGTVAVIRGWRWWRGLRATGVS